VQKLQAQVGDLRQQVGVLEGNLDALRTANARYVDEAAQAREQRDQLGVVADACRRKAEAARSEAHSGPAQEQWPGAQIAENTTILIASGRYPTLVSDSQFLFDAYGESTRKMQTRRPFNSAVKWANLTDLSDPLF
jgi:hypothetical protein